MDRPCRFNYAQDYGFASSRGYAHEYGYAAEYSESEGYSEHGGSITPPQYSRSPSPFSRSPSTLNRISSRASFLSEPKSEPDSPFLYIHFWTYGAGESEPPQLDMPILMRVDCR